MVRSTCDVSFSWCWADQDGINHPPTRDTTPAMIFFSISPLANITAASKLRSCNPTNDNMRSNEQVDIVVALVSCNYYDSRSMVSWSTCDVSSDYGYYFSCDIKAASKGGTDDNINSSAKTRLGRDTRNKYESSDSPMSTNPRIGLASLMAALPVNASTPLGVGGYCVYPMVGLLYGTPSGFRGATFRTFCWGFTQTGSLGALIFSDLPEEHSR
ncbi:hypothetical protein LWI28_020396 [Acer negundo]|uniref:Uncharacterized protein n=1 Tax=Acer negundo TaxID=4023 RepID=A0AAD5JAI8_ACENE|nr:hypothetical protein LWI28_020396 [Acer negundo]